MRVVAPIAIRKASAEDAAQIAAVGAKAFREAFIDDCRPEDMAAYLASTYGVAQQRREMADPDIDTLLAFAGERLAGFLQLRRGGEVPAPVPPDDTVELMRLYVDAAWHGLGVAQELMAAMLTLARRTGARRIWLGVYERNRRAQAFYRKYGFVKVGTHEFVVGTDHQTDDVMLLEPLPAPG